MKFKEVKHRLQAAWAILWHRDSLHAFRVRTGDTSVIHFGFVGEWDVEDARQTGKQICTLMKHSFKRNAERDASTAVSELISSNSKGTQP